VIAHSRAANRPTILLAAVSAIALSLLYLIGPVAATPATNDLHKVTICHRTNSVTNPYVIETVDVASVDGDAGNDNGKGDHLLDHLGPVFDVNNPPPPPHNGDQWGDIIPPFFDDGVTLTGFPSLNWDADGQAIFENGCNLPGESVEESVAESVQESVAESVEQSVAESVEQSVAESAQESVAESEPDGSASESSEQTVEAGTGTPEQSQANTAMGLGGSNPLPTIAFGLILLASLSGLAFVNVKAARNRS
jgi:hypothetical protein